MVLVAAVLFAVTAILPFKTLGLQIAIKMLLLISFPFILYFLKFYEDIEISTIKRIVLKKRDW